MMRGEHKEHWWQEAELLAAICTVVGLAAVAVVVFMLMGAT